MDSIMIVTGVVFLFLGYLIYRGGYHTGRAEVYREWADSICKETERPRRGP